MSKEQKDFIKKEKIKKYIIFTFQILISFFFIFFWELFARLGLINTFITSSPSNVIKTIIDLYNSNNLFIHIFTTVIETFIAFMLTTVISLLFAVILFKFKTFSKIVDPYLIMLNSLPKIALGPIIIIWLGANYKSIIIMAIFISIIISIQNIYNGFKNTDKIKIKLLNTFNASNKDILLKVVIPSNYSVIVNTLKINISMSLIGVIMGEFLTSKQGVGYLILYGSQIFNLNLVITGVIILLLISIAMYKLIVIIEKRLVS